MNSEGRTAVRFSTLLDEAGSPTLLARLGAKDVVLRLRPELVSTCLVLVVVSPHLSPLSLPSPLPAAKTAKSHPK